ncbi:LmeA family phospholipid-binding protein [Streptomyces sp. 8N706]|uniref:LmeA family phospholipid-binding protein n=1 Tax=Streptomyces sp. 8N706 TaxID=3457416 RepID=UPI003FD3F530
MTVLRVRPRRKVAVLAVALVLVGLGVAETVTRSQLSGRFTDRLSERLHADADVDLGVTPVLVRLAQGSIPEVRVSAEGATFRQFSGLSFQAELDSVRRANGRLAIGRTQVRALASEAALTDSAGRIARGGGGGGGLAGGAGAEGGAMAVMSVPEQDALVLQAGPKGGIELGIRPELDGDTIRLKQAGATFRGTPLPPALTQRLTQRIPDSIPLSDLPLGLEPESLEVTSGGVRVGLKGDHATVKS